MTNRHVSISPVRISLSGEFLFSGSGTCFLIEAGKKQNKKIRQLDGFNI